MSFLPDMIRRPFQKLKNRTASFFGNGDHQSFTTTRPLTSLNPFVDKPSNGLIGNVITAVVPDTVEGILGDIVDFAEYCLTKGSGWQDPLLGDFRTTKNSPYCSSNCTRSKTCCNPQDENELDVKFIYATTKQNGDKIRYNDQQSRKWVQMSNNKTLVWIVHGFTDNVTERQLFNDTRDAFLDRGDYDVILVDWSKGADQKYYQSVANVRVVGAIVGRMMDFLGVERRSICSGFSLGSHVCGEAGSWLKKRKNKVIAKCHGIDPAGPQFDGCGPEVRLDPTDCGLVISIHTSQFDKITSLIGKEGLGTKVKSGHCDFWLNDGMDQPNCNNQTSLLQQLIPKESCHHARAMLYYISQIKKECNFDAEEAKCGSAKPCEDVYPDQQSSLSPHRMNMTPDDSCSSAMNVDYHANTTGTAPFC